MSVAWVVVADASRARIFSAENPSGPLVEIQTLAHPEARLHEGDLVSDKSGRDRNTGSGSHDMGNQNEAKQEEAIRFASQVGQALECGRTNKQFKKLYVVAAPGFLGLMRKNRTGSLQKMVTAEISKNMASHDVADIRKCLPDYL